MKRIHILNYESYALDYLEGELLPEDQQAFETFLEQHPEVAAELEGLDEVQLMPPVITYPSTSALYRRRAVSRSWAIAAGWALLVTLSGMLWLQTPEQQNTPAIAQSEDPTPESISVERVSVSHASPTERVGDALQPALRAEQAIHPLPLSVPMVAAEPEPESIDRNMETVACLPLNDARFLRPEVTVVTTGAANEHRSESANSKGSSQGLIDPDKIAVLKPFSRILTEDQKDWVANWRPLETIKEEINRDRWAEALTPEYLYSPKSTK
jgi:hypothetical protein